MIAPQKLICFGAFLMLLSGAISLFAQPQPGTLLWSYTLDLPVYILNPIITSPSVAADGTIYFGNLDGVYAITNYNSSASVKWTFPAGIAGRFGGFPAIVLDHDGTLYFVADSQGDLYALNPDGSQKWVYPAAGGGGSPAIGPDGTIYVEGYSYLHAVSPFGTNKWKSPIGDSYEFSSPSIASDGTIYIGSSEGGEMFAFNSDGTQKWQIALDGPPVGSPAIGSDGTIYVTGSGLYALKPDGSKLWENRTNVFYQASPAIGPDGTVYISASSDLSLNAIKPSGEAKWHAVPHGPNTNLVTTPAIGAGGVIYYSDASNLIALDSSGNVMWTFFSDYQYPYPAFPGVSPAIGPDGTIYACFAKTLYAIAGTNALGNTPWPMYRQNLRHTGKLEKPSLSQLTKRADANFQFQMFGEVGQPYTIQSSTNLASWAVLTNFVAGTQTTAVVDFSASNSPSRFYRALIQ